jgi:topoisomerase-4 subunit A
VIEDNKPLFIGVSDMLKISTKNGRVIEELEIQLSELEEQWHFLSLERIFIENKIVTLRKKTTRRRYTSS